MELQAVADHFHHHQQNGFNQCLKTLLGLRSPSGASDFVHHRAHGCVVSSLNPHLSLIRFGVRSGTPCPASRYHTKSEGP